MKQHHRHTGPTLGKKPKESGLLASLLLWRRAFCLWWKADPRLFTSTAALLLFQTLSPYVTIYFTARLLNEITGACRRKSCSPLQDMYCCPQPYWPWGVPCSPGAGTLCMRPAGRKRISL